MRKHLVLAYLVLFVAGFAGASHTGVNTPTDTPSETVPVDDENISDGRGMAFLPDEASSTARQVLQTIRAGLEDLGFRLSELLGGSPGNISENATDT